MTVRQANNRELGWTLRGDAAELASAVHELRAPLTTIRGFLETLLERGQDLTDEGRRRAIEVALRNTLLLEERIDTLMAIGNPTGAVHPRDRLHSPDAMTSRPTPLRAAVIDIIEDCAGILDGRQVDVHIDPATWAEVDTRGLAHVLTNLLDNAAKFSPGESTITVRASEGLDDVRVEVVDTGVGIDPEELPHVFEPFHRGSRGVSGNGLGLAVVRREVLSWGGTVDITSDPGAGTTVMFTLTPAEAPLVSAPAVDQ